MGCLCTKKTLCTFGSIHLSRLFLDVLKEHMEKVKALPQKGIYPFIIHQSGNTKNIILLGKKALVFSTSTLQQVTTDLYISLPKPP